MVAVNYTSVLIASDFCFLPSMIQANPSVEYRMCDVDCQNSNEIYNFEFRYNLGSFFQTCANDVNANIFNPYSNYSITSAHAHQIVAQNLTVYEGCFYYTQPSSSFNNMSLKEIYENAYGLTIESMSNAQCSTYGYEISTRLVANCDYMLSGLFLTFVGTLFSGIFAFIIAHMSTAFVPNLYRIYIAEKLHRKMLRKLEEYVPNIHSADANTSQDEGVDEGEQSRLLVLS
mmetsp:Transcript_2896/g.3919  ORF Transcript_2896/g.3919 Transcript_2896/m.3919 type:complete len:230 (-) Transcript_2896:513-1202(-)